MSESLSLKNIIVFAASGAVGQGIIRALINVPNSFSVSIAGRLSTPRPASLPSTFKWLPVDYDDPASLSAALKGQDAAVLIFAFGALHLQQVVLDTAIEQGVKFFIPSFYGISTSPLDPGFEYVVDLRGFVSQKIEFEIYMRERAEKGDISFAAIYNSLYLDYGLETAPWLGLDLKAHTAKLVNEGLTPVHTCTIPQIGEATVKILLNANKYKNKSVYITTFTVTQQEVLKELEKQSGVAYKTTKLSPEEAQALMKEGLDALEARNFSIAGPNIVLAAINDPDDKYHVRFSQDDAKALGLTETTTEEVVKKVLSRLA